MTITISAEDTRSIRALEIAAGAAAWLKCRMKSGEKAYAVPSTSKPNAYHLVNTTACSCFDFKRRQQACKHVLAVRLHCELVKASAPKPRAKRPAKPAAAPAPADRGVVLSMVRHADGTLSWERAPHTAADYDRCHSEEAF